MNRRRMVLVMRLPPNRGARLSVAMPWRKKARLSRANVAERGLADAHGSSTSRLVSLTR
jgi:hypothetical protein